MRFTFILLFFINLISGYAMAGHQKNIYGFIEKVTLVDKNLTLSAKLDTGATSASLNATKITEVTVNGKPYLNFIVPSKEGDIAFTCEYVGDVNIKMRVGERVARLLKHHSIKRPVVRMAITLGRETHVIRVNLTNRKRFIYPLLLGREALIAFNGIVDPALKFTSKKNNPSQS